MSLLYLGDFFLPFPRSTPSLPLFPLPRKVSFILPQNSPLKTRGFLPVIFRDLLPVGHVDCIEMARSLSETRPILKLGLAILPSYFIKDAVSNSPIRNSGSRELGGDVACIRKKANRKKKEGIERLRRERGRGYSKFFGLFHCFFFFPYAHLFGFTFDTRVY